MGKLANRAVIRIQRSFKKDRSLIDAFAEAYAMYLQVLHGESEIHNCTVERGKGTVYNAHILK